MGWACRRFGHLPFFLPLRIDAPPCPANLVGGTARRRAGKPLWWRRGPALPGQASIFPIFPIQLSHSASPSSHHSPSRAVSAVPVTEEFSVQILLRTSNPKKSPFFRSSSAMRTASTASGVMDGPKIAMLGSACPGGSNLLNWSRPGLVPIRRPNSSIPCGGGAEEKAGRIVKHDRFNVAPARHNVPEMLFTSSKRNTAASPNTKVHWAALFFLFMPE